MPPRACAYTRGASLAGAGRPRIERRFERRDVMENRGKSKVVAGVLAIVIGALGIHHFYLGSWGAGLILLLVSVVSCGFAAALSGVVGLVEGIMLLIMDDDEFDKRYNQRTPETVEFVFMKPKSGSGGEAS